MRNKLIPLLLSAACADATSVGPTPASPVDDLPPTLDVRSPLRGTLQVGDDTKLQVRGYVHDENGVAVFVNGQRAKVGAGGAFTADVPIAPGLTLVHTIAYDARHNQSEDTRAVLAGDLVSADTPVADGIVARIDAAAIRAGGEALASRLATTDLGAPLARRNPLYQNLLPCVGARADLVSLAHRVVRLGIEPVYDGLSVDAELADLDLGLSVAFSTSCTATRTEKVRASANRFHLRGIVRFSIATDGHIAVDTGELSGWIDGVTVDATLISIRVSADLETALSDRLTTLLIDELAATLPSVVLRGLGDAESGTVVTRLHIDGGGATVAVDTRARVAGGAGAMYLPGATQLPNLEGRRGLAVGIAAVAVNQLLSASWSAGLLDSTIAAAPGAGEGAIAFSSRLSPSVSTTPGGGLRLVFGDVDCQLIERPPGGPEGSVARWSLSVETSVDVRVVDGRVTLVPGPTTTFVDRGEGRDLHANLVGPAGLVVSELVSTVGQLLSTLPLPAGSALMTGEARREGVASDGYLLVSGGVTP